MTDMIGFDSLAKELQNMNEEEIKEFYKLLGLKYDYDNTPGNGEDS